jgi:hypothetical protein
MEGSVFGRPITIDASGKEISLQLPSLAVAWKLRRFASELLSPFSAISDLRAAEMTLRLKVAAWPAIEIFPNPPRGLHLLFPKLRRPRKRNIR